MRIHFAGHLLHDVLMTMVKKLIPLRASHGKKAFIEYKRELNPSIKEKLEEEVNKIAQKGLKIITRFASYDELAKECQFFTTQLTQE